MGQIDYNFGAIEAGAGEIDAAVGRTAGLLDEGKGSLARLQGAWQGEGSDSYQATQMRWDNNSAELNAALQSLAHAIRNAGTTMGSTEQNVTGMFAG
jgi:early secretory antigenic target protein ESAT-6